MLTSDRALARQLETISCGYSASIGSTIYPSGAWNEDDFIGINWRIRMNLRNILVLLDASPASEERLKLAREIAGSHGASLSAVFLRNQHIADCPRLSKVPERLSKQHGTLTDTTRLNGVAVDVIERRSRDAIEPLGGDWYSFDRITVSELVAITQATDLVVAGQFPPDVESTNWRPEDLVVACGRPVLVIPYIGCAGSIGRRVLIAWNGSREATRALNDALPIMSAAEVVTLVTIRPHRQDLARDRPVIGRIVRHLARHGIIAQIDETFGDGPVSDILLSKSADAAVDLIVAGAYHRSRLRESVFGGTSHGLFQSMTVPVFMSH